MFRCNVEDFISRIFPHPPVVLVVLVVLVVIRECAANLVTLQISLPLFRFSRQLSCQYYQRIAARR